MKPGYRTSEFWFTLVSFIFSGLYLTGIINDSQNKDELISVVSHAVESCILISGQFVILYKYINARKNVKAETIVKDSSANKQEKTNESTRKRKPATKTNKPRTNSKGSRKTSK